MTVLLTGFPGVNSEFQELVKACAEAALETNDSELKTKVHFSVTMSCFTVLHAMLFPIRTDATATTTLFCTSSQNWSSNCLTAKNDYCCLIAAGGQS